MPKRLFPKLLNSLFSEWQHLSLSTRTRSENNSYSGYQNHFSLEEIDLFLTTTPKSGSSKLKKPRITIFMDNSGHIFSELVGRSIGVDSLDVVLKFLAAVPSASIRAIRTSDRSWTEAWPGSEIIFLHRLKEEIISTRDFLLPTFLLPDILASHLRTDWLSWLGLCNQ